MHNLLFTQLYYIQILKLLHVLIPVRLSSGSMYIKGW